MLNALNRLFKGRSELAKTTLSAKALPLKDVEDDEIPRYPPFAKGLPVAPLDKILATQAELIVKVRNSLGFTLNDFNYLVLPVIQRYAEFVHLLPASESHHHRGAGGLFRHGLEVAYWAAQASESVIFSIEGTPRERRDNEPRWRLASCFSGLLHDVGKPLSDVSITDKEGSFTWNPYFESLHDWANRHKIDRYFIRWRDKRHKRHEQFSLLAVDRIIPADTREFLSTSGPAIMEAMLEAISGTSVTQPVTKLMLRADQESVSRDLRQSRLDVDEFSYGVPVERYVFDAIRRLVKTGKWKVNEPGAKVWHLIQGVFIAWRQLGDLYDLISHDKIPGIPRDPDTLADILIERGFAVPNSRQEKGERAYYRYWEVLPEMIQDATGSVKILMLRLESNDLVFTNEPPVAVPAEVVGIAKETEIKFVDRNDDDDDQGKGEEALSDDRLTAEKELAELGFNEVMEILKNTSSAKTEEPKGEVSAAKPGKKAKPGNQAKSDTQPPSNITADKKLSPQEMAKATPRLANDNPLQALKDLGGGLTDIDFPFDAFGASPNTASIDKSNPEKTKNEVPAQPEPEFVTQQQTLQQGDEFLIFKDPNKPSSRAIGSLPILSDAVEKQHDKPDKDAKSVLLELLSGYGEATSLLEQAIMPVMEGKTTLGKVLCLMKGQIVILYPQGARSLGAPSEVLSKLSQADAIVPDPIMPGRKVRDFSGIKAIVLAEPLSNAVIAAIKQMGGFENLLECALPPEVDAGKGKPEQKQQRMNKPLQKLAPKSEMKEQRQNLARLPVRDGQPKALNPKVEPKQNRWEVELPERQEQEVLEFEPPKSKANPQDINEVDFLPPGITPSKALQMLKDMIQKRSGRWLVTPVLEENGLLVTSDKAFDMIAGENLGISKHILCGMLSRAQKRPLLKKRQGKLYLELDKA